MTYLKDEYKNTFMGHIICDNKNLSIFQALKEVTLNNC